jgi:hypothetical protein
MPVSPLSKTPVDGMYANYSDFVTLSNNDKYLEDKITAFSLVDSTSNLVYDESHDIQISCGKVTLAVPASTNGGANLGIKASSNISLGSIIPIHVQLTVEGSAHLSAYVERKPNASGFKIRACNTYTQPRTAIVHWLAFHVLPISSNNG